MAIKIVATILVLIVTLVQKTMSRPNIVVIMADDLGWNDVSFHGSNEIPTPNIDALAYDGIILNRHYVPPLCTPSRASLMTGKHPINIGMQHHVIVSDQPWGLGLEEKIMPQYFKEAGYKTHLVGKWHLGFFQRAYTPTKRGFDSHYGYLGPYIDYWDHSLQMSLNSTRGFDMRKNLEVNYASKGTYATDFFNDEAVNIIQKHNTKEPLFLLLTHLSPHTGNEDDPMQAPEEDLRKFSHIKNGNRNYLAAMISKIDIGVGKIFKSLKDRKMLDNTIILFYSDNGAPSLGIHTNDGSNYPMKGQKDSPWEGASRGAAAIWSPLLKTKQRVSNQWFHVSDWLPTLASAAGIRVPLNSEIDGIDQWKTLSHNLESKRSVVLNNIDDRGGYSSLTENGWKFVNRSTYNGEYDHWYGKLNPTDSNLNDTGYVQTVLGSATGKNMKSLTANIVVELRNEAKINCNRKQELAECDPYKAACLFDIINDPCELNNLASSNVDKVLHLEKKVIKYQMKAMPSRLKESDPNSDPANFNGTWTWWLPDPVPKSNWDNYNIWIWKIVIVVLIVIICTCICLRRKRCFSTTNNRKKINL